MELPTLNENESAFAYEVWRALCDLVPATTSEELARFDAWLHESSSKEELEDSLGLAVGARVASSRSVRECIALALANGDKASASPRRAVLACALESAREHFTVEQYARALSEVAVREFDADGHEAWKVRAVLHPEHGPGVADVVPGRGYEDGWSVLVVFPDGKREFKGRAARWEDAGTLFAREASQALMSAVDDAEEGFFWRTVAEVKWGTPGETIERCAERLRSLVSYVDCLAMHSRHYAFSHTLSDVLEAWEKREGQRLECGDDGFMDLRSHIVGLGREEYEATCADPKRAYERARKGDYEESFAYVFQNAERLYPSDELERALRTHGSPTPWSEVRVRPSRSKVLEHPEFGVGVVAFDQPSPEAVSVAFAERLRRLPLPT